MSPFKLSLPSRLSAEGRLRRRIEREVDLSGSGLDRLRALCAWTFGNVPFPARDREMEGHFGHQIQYEPLVVTLPLLARCEFGFSCAGSSYVLARLCRMFGMDAFVYNCGRLGASHVVSLVRLAGEGAPDLYVVDAHFNAELQKNGKPLPFGDFLQLCRDGSLEEAVWHFHAERRRTGVVSPESEVEFAAEWRRHFDARRLGRRRSSIRYELSFCAFDERGRGSNFRELLSYRFGTENLAALLLLPLGTSGEAEAEAWAAEARLVGEALGAPRAGQTAIVPGEGSRQDHVSSPPEAEPRRRCMADAGGSMTTRRS